MSQRPEDTVHPGGRANAKRAREEVLNWHQPLGECKLKSHWDATTPLAWGPKSKKYNSRCRQGCREAAGEDLKWGSHFGKKLGLLLKTTHALTCKLATAVLGIYAREMKTCGHTKACEQISARPKLETAPSLSRGDWLNKLWRIHAMCFYSSAETNRLW